MAVTQTLSVTEVSGSVNTSANTSKVRILWKSTQTGDSWNGYTRTAKYYISVNGGAEIEYSVNYTLPQSSTTTIVDTTVTVAHRSDGSGTVKVRTWMDTSISAGVVEKSQTLTLTTIPRASTITSADTVTLGGNCKIRWTPASTSFRYKLKFSLGNWSYTTAALAPGTLSTYTYTGYSIPIEVANQFPNAKSGTMTVTLYTYSSDATTQIGSESTKTFTVILPENTSTKPTVTMTLSPVTPYEKFASLYLKGRSKVKATFSGSGKYGSTVVSIDMRTEGKSYPSPYTSDILRNSGDVTVVGTVKDSRGFSNTTTGTINVIAYEAPYIAPSAGYKKVICERCTENGTASDKGTYLHVKGTRNYTKINVNGIVNTCSVRCRYKPEGGAWSHGSGDGVGVLLWTNTSTDAFDVILPNIVTSIRSSYIVELNIIDDTNLPSTMTFDIPSESVDFELRNGGRGAAFGKHASAENLFECEWDAQFNGKSTFGGIAFEEKDIFVDGDDNTYYPVHIKPTHYAVSQPVYVGIGKSLGTSSGIWEGNHSTGTSSLTIGWLLRFNGWDGNGDYISTLYKAEDYAPLIANVQGYAAAAKGIVVHLRGGGASYKIACSAQFKVNVYLSEADISDSAEYSVTVSPRDTLGNQGVLFKNDVLANVVIEEGELGVWTYRKWSNGTAECWGRHSVTIDIKTAWGSLFYGQIAAIDFPITFVSVPSCQVSVESGTAVWLACNVRATTTKTPSTMVCRTSSTEAHACDIVYYAKGKWK